MLIKIYTNKSSYGTRILVEESKKAQLQNETITMATVYFHIFSIERKCFHYLLNTTLINTQTINLTGSKSQLNQRE